jgi:hypothetical protein
MATRKKMRRAKGRRRRTTRTAARQSDGLSLDTLVTLTEAGRRPTLGDVRQLVDEVLRLRATVKRVRSVLMLAERHDDALADVMTPFGEPVEHAETLGYIVELWMVRAQKAETHLATLQDLVGAVKRELRTSDPEAWVLARTTPADPEDQHTEMVP